MLGAMLGWFGSLCLGCGGKPPRCLFCNMLWQQQQNEQRHINMKNPLGLASCALVLVLCGCAAGGPAVSDRNKIAAIKTVTVRETVDLPPSGMGYSDQSMAGAAVIAGAIGAIVASSTTTKPEQVRQAMKSNNIQPETILRDSLIKELIDSKRFAVKDGQPADAEIRITIVRYGLAFRPWHEELVPVCAVQAELVPAAGSEPVWRHTRQMNNHSDSDVPAVLFDDYMKEPERLRIGYQKACGIAARDLVANLVVGE
jgi:hypothetical protein